MILLNHSIQDLQGFNVTTKELLNIISSIRLGQVLRGKILDVLPTGEILALINGYKIKAHSDLKLEPGDILFLKVMSVKPSIVLRLYGIEYAQNNDPVNKVIKMFGLEENIPNREIISLLLKNNLSIDKSEIIKLANIYDKILTNFKNYNIDKEQENELKQLIYLTKNNNIAVNEKNIIESMIFLKLKNLPITVKTSLIALNYLKSDNDFSKDITDFFNLLRNYNGKINILNNIEKLNFLPNRKFSIEELINVLGYDYEKKISNLDPKNVTNINSTLKFVALEVINGNIQLGKMELQEKLKLVAHRILNNIEFHQLLNSEETNDIKNWFFQIPIKIDNEYKMIDLKISGNSKKSNKINKIPYTFSFSIDLSNLGKIKTYGSLYQKYLSLNFYSDNTQKSSYLQENIAELESKINDLGITLNNISFEILGTENKNTVLSSFNENNSSINIRA
ncbi:MAG TPA: hypothetical protein PKW14_09635 [Bacteroidota bacterium]|jgi:hypothetical protein|nr:hypothetical protein [Bacteroidota bacterium]